MMNATIRSAASKASSGNREAITITYTG